MRLSFVFNFVLYVKTGSYVAQAGLCFTMTLTFWSSSQVLGFQVCDPTCAVCVVLSIQPLAFYMLNNHSHNWVHSIAPFDPPAWVPDPRQYHRVSRTASFSDPHLNVTTYCQRKKGILGGWGGGARFSSLEMPSKENTRMLSWFLFCCYDKIPCQKQLKGERICCGSWFTVHHFQEIKAVWL